MSNTPFDGIGFMGMVDNMNNGNQPDRAIISDKPVVNDGSEWTCPLCGATNTGRFCCFSKNANKLLKIKRRV